jgi:hypothetical protein
VGLKDVVERIAGKRSTAQRGKRGPRERKRDRDEPTIQVQSPIASPPAQPAARPSSAPPAAVPVSSAPPPPQPVAPAPAPVATAAPAPARAAAPAPPPAATAPPPVAPPAPRPVVSSEATQYVTVPSIADGELVGVLVGIAGELKGQMFKIFDGDCRLGRSQDCDVVLLDPKVSREHAKILGEGSEMVIIPLSERNPIYINDEKVEEADQLSDGDMLRLGNPGSSTFRFRTIEGL